LKAMYFQRNQLNNATTDVQFCLGLYQYFRVTTNDNTALQSASAFAETDLS